mmetsp:Transcript_52731/g.83690  ORF Transcript_52731/g.83690 Transcript_52731/m.83690 type:complete len:545 (+) Transcript_52731:92-1726(+)|eukprot:CAMPEP_0169113762 /NCGR_PEP_ID=MMETSP1015-20121227/28384_1 /TAXON_ID=342587 /ORGANISM="Karlodinium micrum, Strain CCMP2283" /LENGTH=544 /DNA_ID=CAMNT_0009175973 /DNA_START=87 /DNA_END=1721 /DNA_ORIENTATION=-
MDVVGGSATGSDELGTARVETFETPGERLAAEIATDRRQEGIASGLNLEAFGSALETVAAMRRGRPASPRVFGATASVMQKSGTPSRAGSTPGTSRMPTTVTQAMGNVVSNKVAQESAILTAVRRQMELLEDKLTGQIGRVQQQNDRLRDAALSRVDSKMGTMEALQPKLDRRLAELSGNYKGLSDEMQAQIRRLDQMDSRLWDWRRELEEEVRGKFVELEQNYQKVASSVRVMKDTTADSSKRFEQRLARHECILEERLGAVEELQHHVLILNGRVEEMDNLRLQDLTLAAHATSGDKVSEAIGLSSQESAALLSLESRMSDSFTKLERVTHECNEMHTRMEAQEERLKSVQTRVETKEEHYRWLNDRVERFDWEGRFKDIQSKLEDYGQSRIETRDELEVLNKRLEKTDQASEEFAALAGRMRGSMLQEAPLAEEQVSQIINAVENLQLEAKESLERIVDLEALCGSLRSGLSSLQSEPGLAPRVAELVDQLKNVAPKVIEQELSMKEQMEKVGRLEVDFRFLKNQLHGHTENNDFRSIKPM